MIKIDQDAIYSAGELRGMFRAHGAKWDTLRDRLEREAGLRKVTDAGWLGSDILAALRVAPVMPRLARKALRVARMIEARDMAELEGLEREAPAALPAGAGKRRRGRPPLGLRV
jgi:PIN domain nuclease of toxin-antitoxin system